MIVSELIQKLATFPLDSLVLVDAEIRHPVYHGQTVQTLDVPITRVSLYDGTVTIDCEEEEDE